MDTRSLKGMLTALVVGAFKQGNTELTRYVCSNTGDRKIQSISRLAGMLHGAGML